MEHAEATEIHRFSVGSIDCYALRDGSFGYPVQRVFQGAPSDALEEALVQGGIRSREITTPYTCLLIDTGSHRVLLDAGAGPGMPFAGKVVERLGALGVPPDLIDTVVVSHGHPDHIGGLTHGQQQLTFPHARFVMDQAEWDFWTSEANLAEMQAHGEFFMAIAARNNLPPIREHLSLVRGDTEIVPGVEVRPAPGHTPGHLALVIHSDDEVLFCAVDTAMHPISLEHPDWGSGYDLDPERAEATRRRVIEEVAGDQGLALFYHFPFPGLGRIARRGNRHVWEPVS